MGNDTVISVQGLGRCYRIAHQAQRQRYKSLRDVLADKTKAMARRIWSPFRTQSPISQHASPRIEEFWALRDVSFEVRCGDVLGIIGRNGAGKSTLLKILSRITEPSLGRVRIKGRVASLLEVGTGFHPELTGRENIFLNGAILGMRRTEIINAFDSIVAFAEVEKFLDTPVKRYSSGMYVRLAFAVAAHLEPEILIVDEVLAVGDAHFQKKCLGKMQEVGRSGRTVLFVSHNMAAVRKLTMRSIVLESGRVVFNGDSDAAVAQYAQLGNRGPSRPASVGKGEHTAVLAAQLLDETDKPTSFYVCGRPMRLEMKFQTDGTPSLSLETFLRDATGQKLGLASLHQFHGRTLPVRAGRYRTLFELSPMWLASGNYSFDITTSVVNSRWDHYVEGMLEFEVVYSNPGGQAWDFKQSLGFGALAMPAQVEPKFEPE